MSQQRQVIGLDIGGTKIMAALIEVPPEGHSFTILKSTQEPTTKKGSLEIYAQLQRLIETVHPPSSSCLGIGIAAPGPIDRERDILAKAPNLPGWVNLPFKARIAKEFNLPAVMENDANAAALAEAKWGAGHGHRFVLYATISTGIGTGFVIDGRLYLGRTGTALEGGHLTIDHQGASCKCGLKGCIEAYASGTAMTKRAALYIKRPPADLTAARIRELAANGHRQYQKLTEDTGKFLGIWLGNMMNILDPDIIVLGGGVSKFGHPLFKMIRQTAPRFSVNPKAKKVPIVPAKLDAHVGVLGAAAVFLTQHHPNSALKETL